MRQVVLTEGRQEYDVTPEEIAMLLSRHLVYRCNDEICNLFHVPDLQVEAYHPLIHGWAEAEAPDTSAACARVSEALGRPIGI